MFAHEIMQPNHFTRKADSVSSYRQWCMQVGINSEQFPFEVDANRMFKNKPITHKIVSWGNYLNSSGVWVCFVAYRFNAMKHTTQYSWHCNELGMIEGEPTKNEWIN